MLQFSDDPNRNQGGVLDAFGRGEMEEVFESEVFRMKIHETKSLKVRLIFMLYNVFLWKNIVCDHWLSSMLVVERVRKHEVEKKQGIYIPYENVLRQARIYRHWWKGIQMDPLDLGAVT